MKLHPKTLYLGIALREIAFQQSLVLQGNKAEQLRENRIPCGYLLGAIRGMQEPFMAPIGAVTTADRLCKIPFAYSTEKILVS